MKLSRGFFITAFVLSAAISAFGYLLWYKPEFTEHTTKRITALSENEGVDRREVVSRLKLKASLAKDYITYHRFNLFYCFLVDMRIPSGKNRFFVYDLKKDSVEIAGLVTHGSGSDNGDGELIFSNEANSYCTSLGKYKVGGSYNGRFGLAYKLYGLDETNNKAFERFVVLHSHVCVPDEEIFPHGICVSLGCPTVSPAFLEKLKKYLDSSSKPVLLWIYY